MITGRSKDLIKSGGEWINPAEIEALVCALPEVSLAAVIGRPTPNGASVRCCWSSCARAQEITDQALLDALRGRIASWWIPDTRRHAAGLDRQDRQACNG
jgi:acyl-CoA synthetase (AMP-forming)/AMP-acid ligase II